VLFCVVVGGFVPGHRLDGGGAANAVPSRRCLVLPVARSRWWRENSGDLRLYVHLLGPKLDRLVCVFRFVPLERIGMSANLGLSTALIFFGICLPFVPLGAT